MLTGFDGENRKNTCETSGKRLCGPPLAGNTALELTLTRYFSPCRGVLDTAWDTELVPFTFPRTKTLELLASNRQLEIKVTFVVRLLFPRRSSKSRVFRSPSHPALSLRYRSFLPTFFLSLSLPVNTSSLFPSLYEISEFDRMSHGDRGCAPERTNDCKNARVGNNSASRETERERRRRKEG